MWEGEKVEKRFDVIGVEDLIMDFALQINRIPKTDGMSMIKDSCWAGGGNASSAIVALSRLGAKCAMVGTTGNDAYGDFCLEDMKRNGVDTSHIKQVEGDTTLCVCLAETETQGRSFLGKMGVQGVMTPEEVGEDFIRDCKVIHLSCMPSPAQAAAIAFAKKHGVEISLDAGAFFPGARELAEQTDILIMSENFYGGLFGEDRNYCENCKKLVEKGAKIAVVTLGKKGCAGADKDGSFELDSFSGAEIVDTTGAGDVFHGGFLYAYLYRYGKRDESDVTEENASAVRGASDGGCPDGYTLEDCARFASAVSYINCTTLGGRPGIPTLDMVDTFLEKGIILEGDIAQRKEFYRKGIFNNKEVTLH